MLKDSCLIGLNILKVLSGPKRGAHPKILIRIFNAIVLSKIIYGTKIINLSDVNTEKLQKLQNRGIRSCLGLVRSTPITAVVAEAGMLPLKWFMERHSINYITGLLRSNIELSEL